MIWPGSFGEGQREGFKLSVPQAGGAVSSLCALFLPTHSFHPKPLQAWGHLASSSLPSVCGSADFCGVFP